MKILKNTTAKTCACYNEVECAIMNLRGYDEVVSKCQKYHTMSTVCYNEVERAIMKLRCYVEVV